MTAPADPSQKRHLLFVGMLGALCALGPLSLSMHVQSIPVIVVDLASDYATVQLTVSLFLATFGLGMLLVGPLSDRLGRRPVLFGGLAVFAAASLSAALAPTADILIAARIGQAAGGAAAIIVARAVVQDAFPPARVAATMALVAMLQSIAPAAAPILGGVVDWLLGWRAVFGLLAVTGIALFVLSATRLAETNPHRRAGTVAGWGEIAVRFLRLLGLRRYVGYVILLSFATCGLFGFLSVGPAVIIGVLGHSRLAFSIMLFVIAAMFSVGNYCTSRLLRRMHGDRVLKLGALLNLFAMSLLFAGSFVPSAVTIVIPMCLYAIASGLVFPNAISGAVSVDPRIAGSAASFQGFAQLASGAVLAFVIAALPTDTMRWMAFACLVMATGAVAALLLLPRRPAHA